MDTARIIKAAQDIERCQRALAWLRGNGSALDGRNKESASVSVHINFASALPGAKEASEVLSAYATLSLPDLVEAAIRSCENTIDMCSDAIRAEGVSK